MIFPVICPICQSDSGRRVIPDSPEVETFRCEACHHVWSEPAIEVRRFRAEPGDFIPWRLRLRAILKQRR
jgi:hypothetical protein